MCPSNIDSVCIAYTKRTADELNKHKYPRATRYDPSPNVHNRTRSTAVDLFCRWKKNLRPLMGANILNVSKRTKTGATKDSLRSGESAMFSPWADSYKSKRCALLGVRPNER